MKYAAFYGNIYKCPFDRRLTTCPFYPMKQLPFKDKFKWFEDLRVEEKDVIVEQHNHCATERAKKSYCIA